MEKFTVPTKDQVSTDNQAIFDTLNSKLGFVPNLYAYYAKNETALGDFLAISGRKSTLKTKEKELVSLVTSQINGCEYCLAAHTALGKMNGFTDEQIIEIRGGSAGFDSKLDALAKFTQEAVNNKGKVANHVKDAFFNAGYTEANLIDVNIVIGEKTISNFIHNQAQFSVDFPAAPELNLQTA